MAPRPLNVVFRRKLLEIMLEGQFIRDVVLGGIGRPLRLIPLEEDASIPLMDDMLFLTMGAPGDYLLEAVAKSGVKNVGYFHVGDEVGAHDCAFYAQADYVLRNYWFAERMAKNVVWVPNGWANGVGPARPDLHLPFGERRHLAFFSGVLERPEKPLDERREMAETIRAHKIPATVAATHGFGQGFGPTPYAAYMGDSRFALVPAGNSPETIRFYDALELGAIPVCLKSPFISEGGPLAGAPVVALDSWEAFADFIAPHLDPTPALFEAWEEKRLAMVDWWAGVKRDAMARVAGVVP